MSDKSNREVGDAFEEAVVEEMEDANILVRKTKNSGAKFDDGDGYTATIQFECKHQNRKSPMIIMKEFRKIKGQARRQNKLPVLFIETNEGERFAVLEMDAYIRHYLAAEESID